MSTVYKRGDGACFLARVRGRNYSASTGYRKELRYSNMMDRNGKMEQENVRQRKAGGKDTCWFHLFHMRTVSARSLEPFVSISQNVNFRILERHSMKFW